MWLWDRQLDTSTSSNQVREIIAGLIGIDLWLWVFGNVAGLCKRINACFYRINQSEFPLVVLFNAGWNGGTGIRNSENTSFTIVRTFIFLYFILAVRCVRTLDIFTLWNFITPPALCCIVQCNEWIFCNKKKGEHESCETVASWGAIK